MTLASRITIVLGAAVLAVPLTITPAAASPLATSLTGAAEVPGPGDPDGSGTFVAKAKPAKGELCYTLTVSNIDPATAAHVHVGDASVAGGVVIHLAAPSSGSVTACATASRELLRAIVRNPELYYVNVHNPAYPAGAVRGQLG